jgi:hypothetical protein
MHRLSTYLNNRTVDDFSNRTTADRSSKMICIHYQTIDIRTSSIRALPAIDLPIGGINEMDRML